MRRKKTARDFPPEFLDAWKLAVEGKLFLPMEAVGMARNLIQQLYTFRKRLSEESPEIAAPFFLVDLRVHDEDGRVITGKPTKVPAKAIIRPFNPTWKEAIRLQLIASDNGIPVGDPAHSGLIPIGPEVAKIYTEIVKKVEDVPDTLSETLSDLGYSTGEGK